MRFRAGLRRAVLTGRRRLISLLCLAGLLAALAIPLGGDAAAGNDDYPSRLKAAAQDSLVDPWIFYNRECTSFVAWRLNHDAGVAFNDYWLGKHWGNASNWKYAAGLARILVDNYPRVGSVAWWAQGSPGSSRGHVAWVESVGSSSITIEEYNYLSRGHYDERVIARTSSMWPSGFIHIGDQAMKNTARPTTSGVTQVGVPLTVKAGTWTPAGASYTYQWLASGVAISGATRSSFAPTADLAGKQLTVKVTASKPGIRSSSATTVATPAVAPGVFTTTGQPQIAGTPQVGKQLTAAPGTWSPSATYSYQWYAAGAPVTGATGATFTPGPAQVGKVVSVVVTAAAPGYKSASRSSDATAAVAPGRLLNTATPTVSGTPQVGRQLTASPGTWSPDATYSYQWYADGSPVAGATGPTFTPAAEQVAKRVTVAVTAALPGYTTASASSSAGSAVAPGTFTTSKAPAVKGSPQVGAKLTADPGSWSPDATYTYQWFVATTAVTGATGSTYVPTPQQLGKSLSVQVTAEAPGYTPSAVRSAASHAVAPGVASNVVAPSVVGDAMVGQSVAASPGTWSVTPAHVAYQWVLDGSPIPGATTARYAPKTTDGGHLLTVGVTATATGYAPATKQAAPKRVVMGAVRMTRPTVQGDEVLGQTLTVRPGAVSPTTAKASYRWLRDGSAIKGATAATYRLRAGDVGHRLAVDVTASNTGWSPTTVRTSSSRLVLSTPRLVLRAEQVGHRIRLGATVRSSGVVDPSGVLTVRGERGRLLAQWQVENGVAHGRLASLAPGLRHLRAFFHGPMQTHVRQPFVVRVS